jgi:3-dehydroquinate dehydratase
MSAHRRDKIPTCAVVGVIASTDELRLATRMRAPPDLFELRLDHLPNLDESQLSKLRRPLIITARHPAEGGKRCNRKNLLRKFLPYAKFVDIELRSMRELREVWAEARRLESAVFVPFTTSNERLNFRFFANSSLDRGNSTGTSLNL